MGVGKEIGAELEHSMQPYRSLSVCTGPVFAVPSTHSQISVVVISRIHLTTDV